MSQPPGKLHSEWVAEEDSWHLWGLCWTLCLRARGRLQDGTMTVVSGSTWAVLTGKCQFCSVTGLLNTCELSRCLHGQNMPTHKVFREGKAIDICIPEPSETGEQRGTAQPMGTQSSSIPRMEFKTRLNRQHRGAWSFCNCWKGVSTFNIQWRGEVPLTY